LLQEDFMATPNLQEVMRTVTDLSFADKLTLAAFLLEQMKHDASPSPSNGNGLTHKTSATMPDSQRRREMQWIKEHRQEYAGQYVALDGDRLVAHGFDGKQVITEARKTCPDALFHRFEALDELPFGGW
jgi:hypothetical protein